MYLKKSSLHYFELDKLRIGPSQTESKNKSTKNVKIHKSKIEKSKAQQIKYNYHISSLHKFAVKRNVMRHKKTPDLQKKKKSSEGFTVD